MDEQRDRQDGGRDTTPVPPEPLLPRHDAGFVPPASRPVPDAVDGAAPQGRSGGVGPEEAGAAREPDQAAAQAPFPGSDQVDRERVLAGAGYTSAEPSNDPVAVAAVVLGIAGLIPLVGLAGAVCGHIALRRLRTSYRGGAGLAVAGIVLGYTLTALWVLFYLATRGVAA